MIKKYIDRLINLSNLQKRKLFLRIFLFSLFIFPIVIISLYSYVRINKELTNLVLEHRESVAYLASTTLKERFDRLVDIGVALASRVRFRQLISEGKWREAIQILKSVPRDFPFVDRVFLTDIKGTETADWPELIGGVGRNFAFRDWYKGVSKEWKPYVSEVYKRTAEPQYNLVAVAAPIRAESKEQEVIGILVIQLKLETFFDWAKKIEVGKDGFVYFVDNHGHIAAHPRFSPQGEIIDFSDEPIVQKALSGGYSIEIIEKNRIREASIVAYRPVDKYGWAVFVEQPLRSAFAVRNSELSLVLIIYGVIILFNLLVAYLIYTLLMRLNEYWQKEKIILESIGDGVVAIDRSWNLVAWNKSATAISGWSKDEVLRKPLRSYLKFIKEYDRTENIAFIEEAMLFGRTGYLQNNTVLVTKSGKEVPCGDSAAPIFDASGKVDGAVIIFRDISRERESQLLQSDFAYASHQLRTPVTKALWGLETLMEKKSSKILQKEIFNVYLSMKSVNKLMGQILEVSEIDQRRVTPKIEAVKIVDIIDEVVKEQEKDAKSRDVRISVSPFSAFLSINTCSKLLKRILFEVLDNAVEYSQPGSEVKLNVKSDDQGILIEITDTGMGIPENQKPLVFTKFFRGNNIDTTASVGAGLGLFIAREYLKLLDGKIWFQSEKNKETTFSISLKSKKD